jgi:hypothetical protein
VRARPAPARGGPGPFDTSALRPLSLRYRGAHRGDHQPWIYEAQVSIEPATHAGEPAWRATYRIEHISPANDLPPQFESTTLVHRDTLVLLEGEDSYGGSFGNSRTRLSRRGKRLLVERDEGGKKTARHIDAPRALVRELDLFVVALPLRVGYRTDFERLDDLDNRVRAFTLTVERQERVRVPAGEFDAWRIGISPRDGNQRLATTYQVRTSAPRVVLRKEYVVNPETKGQMKRSVGTEELASIEGPRINSREARTGLSECWTRARTTTSKRISDLTASALWN